MANSGLIANLIQDALQGQQMIGLQVQPPPPLSREQFDKTDVRQTQLIRFRKGAGATEYYYEICIPGSEGASDPPTILIQNGVSIGIAADELTRVDNGPWWTINKASYPETAVLGIYAVVVPDQGGTSTLDWPVSGSYAKLKFKRDGSGTNGINNAALILAAAAGFERGLYWEIAGINGTVVSVKYQFRLGVVTNNAMMGDGDANGVSSTQAATASSIVRQRNGVYQLVNLGMQPNVNDQDKPMVIVDTVAGKRVTKLMAQPIVSGSSDAPPSNPATTTTLGPHDTGESALDNSQVCDGSNGIKLWVVTGVVYNPSGDHIIYGFRRLITITPNGRVYSVGAETKFTVATPEPI